MCPDKDEDGSPYWNCYAFDEGCDAFAMEWYDCYWDGDCTVYNEFLAASVVEEEAAATTTDNADADTTADAGDDATTEDAAVYTWDEYLQCHADEGTFSNQ